jgi:hypothetical protein
VNCRCDCAIVSNGVIHVRNFFAPARQQGSA